MEPPSSDADGINANMRTLIAAGELVREDDERIQPTFTTTGLSLALKDHKVFRLAWEGEHWYPAFLLGQEPAHQQLRELSAYLGAMSASNKWLFFTTRRGSLATEEGVPRNPIEALRDGEHERVRRAADGFLEVCGLVRSGASRS